MSMFEDYVSPLPASGSAGLEGLPPSPELGIGNSQAPAPVEDRSVPASLNFAAPTDPAQGLGMATAPTEPPAGRAAEDKEYINSLPTLEKLGLLLQSYQAGVEGRPSPVQALLDSKRKREAEMSHELRATIDTTSKAMEMVRKMPEGKARDALIEQVARTAGPNGDLVRNALGAVGGADETEVRGIVSVLANPFAQSMIVKASGGDPNKARTLLADKDFMQSLTQRADQTVLPALVTKMSVLSRTFEKMPNFKGDDGKVTFTMSDLREQNSKLPKDFRLSEAELDAANRNQATLAVYGLKTDKTLQEEQSAQAKRKDSGTWSEPYDLNGAMVQKNSASGEIRTAVTRAPREPSTEQAPTVVEIADPNDPTKSIKIDAKTGKKIGDSPQKGSTKPLPAPLQKSLSEAGDLADATTRFATTFKENFGGKLITGDLGNKVGRLIGDETGQAQWWQDYELHQAQVRNKLFGSALTAPEIEAWEKSAINTRMAPGEIRKNLARREQLEARALDKLMKGAAAGGYSRDQIEAYSGRAVPEASAKGASPPPAKTGTAEAPPAGIPAGSKAVGFSTDGKRVWQDPSGKKWKE